MSSLSRIRTRTSNASGLQIFQVQVFKKRSQRFFLSHMSACNQDKSRDTATGTNEEI